MAPSLSLACEGVDYLKYDKCYYNTGVSPKDRVNCTIDISQ
ncbi:hypothetical protein CCACVL1_21533, partial [Corchorus capsularis]